MHSSRTSSRSSARGDKAAVEIDTSKYDNWELKDLKEKRKSEIAEMNFEEVAVLDAAIAKFNTDNSTKIMNDCKEAIAKQIDDSFAEYERAIEENAQQWKVKEEEMLASQADAKESITTEHQNRMGELEAGLEKKVERERARPSAQNEILKNKAKLLAKNADVQQAIEVRDMAKESLQEELAQREMQVKESYERSMNGATVKFTSRIDAVDARIAKWYEDRDDQMNKFMIEQQKKVANTVRASLRKETANAQKNMPRKDKWAEVTQELIQFVQDKLIEEDRAFIFDVQEQGN